MSLFREQLLCIKNSKSYEGLKELIDPSKIALMPADEVDLLVQLLVLQGAEQLARGDKAVIETFEKAAKISANAPYILYKQGLIYAHYPSNARCLLLAHQSFTKACQQDPAFFEAFYEDAKVLFQMGLFESDAHHITQADLRFESAFALLEKAQSTSPLAEDDTLIDFYWRWGCCLSKLGALSGEPLDFHKAVEKFQIVEASGLKNAVFYNDYGNTLAFIGMLLSNKSYYLEALKRFGCAIKESPNDFNGWFHQACCLQHLSALSMDLEMLQVADNSFAKAAQLNPNYNPTWFKWAQLSFTLGRCKADVSKLESALEKFEKAHDLEPNQPVLLCHWAEAELFLGSSQENLDLILSAKSKILKSLEVQPELSETWYLYGLCLQELGHYFEDEAYYLQAIEKIQYGLSLNSSNPSLWYAMALVHYSLGGIRNDQALIEKAVRFFSRVVDLKGGGNTPQFWYDWGIALLKLGEMTELTQYVEWAIEKFEKALSFPGVSIDKDQMDLEGIYHYGCAFDLLGDLTGDYHYFEKAIHILSQVVQLDPEDKEARYNLALAFYHLGEAVWDVEIYQKAIEHFQILVEEEPEDSIVHIDYAITLVSLARLIYDVYQPTEERELLKQAEGHLVQAASLGNYQAYYHLAGLYSLVGLYPQALHFIEKAQFFGVLPSIVDLIHDDWLEGLRQTNSFRQFLDGLSSQSKDEK